VRAPVAVPPRILGAFGPTVRPGRRSLETTVRRILDTVAAFNDAAWAWWTDVAAQGSWPPSLGPWLLALVVLLLLAALRRRRPPPLEVRPPQLLITQGEVVPEAAPQAPARRRRRAGDPGAAQAGRLTMTVSNLSRYPVQVLEVALRQESRGAPRVAELEAVVPPLGALEVETRVPLGLAGDGWLDVYCYAAAPRHKLHRHRVELVWEPWVSRFKVAPMEQVTAPAKRLASDESKALFDLPEPPLTAYVEPMAPLPTGAGVRLEASAPADSVAAKPSAIAATPSAVAVPPATGTTAKPPVATPARPDAAAVRKADAAVVPRPEAAAVPKADTTALGALWARLPRRDGARDDARPGGSPEDEVTVPADGRKRLDRSVPERAREASDAPSAVPGKPERPKLEFPDDF
jgi:MYXO-CTERM domain-containing protein